MGETFKKTILIDLDGVLNKYCGIYETNQIPDIKEGTAEFLEELSSVYEVKIFTSRKLLKVAKWLFENGLDKYIDDITNIKIPAYLHIDDRTIRYKGNYNKTLEEIKNFRVHWKR